MDKTNSFTLPCPQGRCNDNIFGKIIRISSKGKAIVKEIANLLIIILGINQLGIQYSDRIVSEYIGFDLDDNPGNDWSDLLEQLTNQYNDFTVRALVKVK